MKKMMSLLFFAIALVWTWVVANSTAAVGFETHAAIQAKLSEIILATIKEKKPDLQSAQITRLWTEAIDDHKVLAHFEYSFIEKEATGGAVEQVVDGEAVLYRQAGENTQDDWVIQQVKTNSDSIQFTEGSVINGKMNFKADGTPSDGEDEDVKENAKEESAAQKDDALSKPESATPQTETTAPGENH